MSRQNQPNQSEFPWGLPGPILGRPRNKMDKFIADIASDICDKYGFDVTENPHFDGDDPDYYLDY